MPALDSSSPEKYFPIPSNEIDSFLPSLQVEKIFLVGGKLPSSDGKAVQKACSKLNLDERTCKEYIQHPQFLASKAEKRRLERNTIPENKIYTGRTEKTSKG